MPGFTLFSIQSRAFIGSNTVKKIILPDSIRFIGNFAFSDCSNLETIVMSKNLVMVDKSAFAGCNKLTSLSFPASLQYLSKQSFVKCTSLKTIEFCGTSDVNGTINLPEGKTVLVPIGYHATTFATAMVSHGQPVCKFDDDEKEQAIDGSDSQLNLAKSLSLSGFFTVAAICFAAIATIVICSCLLSVTRGHGSAQRLEDEPEAEKSDQPEDEQKLEDPLAPIE